jgi:methionyl-tRNA formyltransferase
MRTPALKVVIACGHRSTLGLEGLPFLLTAGWKISAVVLASPERWSQFDRQLNPPSPPSLYQRTRKRWANYRADRRLKTIRQKNNFPLISTPDINSPALHQQLQTLEPDLLICIAFPQLFGRPLLELPKKGCINIHPSLLPAFAGAHPHFWAIRTGASMSGLTAHRMTTTIDEGPILAQVKFSIKGRYYSEVYRTITEHLPPLFHQLQENLEKGVFLKSEQPPSRYKNNRLEDSKIDWKNQSLEEILQIIRTETAYFYRGSRPIRVYRAERTMDQKRKGIPGQVIRRNKKGVAIQCKDGILLVKTIRWMGRNWSAGHWWRVRPGIILEWNPI